ncbi:MAG: exodeoxyribonuclease III [Gaiellales bacterium]
MLLVTWNVNSIGVRLPRLLELLEKHRPDVVCLQETKADPARFPRLDLAQAGYQAVDHSGGRWEGVALLARDDLGMDDLQVGLPGETQPLEARWVEATVAGVRVASVYVPNGRQVGSETFASKLHFLEAMSERVASLPRPLVVAGDMNVAPSDLDVYDPAAFVGSTHVTPDERGRLQRLADAGMVDAFRHLHPDEAGYTWWDYRQGHFHRGLGLRIDLALVSPEIAANLRTCGIDRNFRKGPKPSDHAPLLVEWSEPAP